MNWKDGIIDECCLTESRRFHDDRGWLSEVFRNDEPPNGHQPAMVYLSETRPGVTRGPHAHEDQTDLFAFFDGQFRVFLWDPRPDSKTEGVRQIFEAGRENPCTLTVPPGVVHAYKNIGGSPALILNCPDRLYAGKTREEPIDEIRYEDQPESDYRMD